MKLNLKKISWRALPTETFTTTVNGEEYEVDITALDGQAMIELNDLPEKEKLAFIIAKGMNVSLEEAKDVIKHDLSFAGEVAKRILDLSTAFHDEVNKKRRGSLTITALQSTLSSPPFFFAPRKTGRCLKALHWNNLHKRKLGRQI